MELNKKNVRTILLIITFAVVMFNLFQNLGAVFGAVGSLFRIFGTVILGLIIAFVLNVPLRTFETRAFRRLRESSNPTLRRITRPLSIVCSIAAAVGVIVLVLVVVLPQLSKTIAELTSKLPGYITVAIDWVENLLVEWNVPTDIVSNLAIDWEATFLKLVDYLSTGATTLVGKLTGVGAAIASSIASFGFGIVIAIYVLARKESIGGFCKRVVVAFLPERAAVRVLHIASKSNDTFSSFVSGQVTEACILGLLCYLGMRIFRFPYAEVTSVTVGVMALIPIVGAFIGVAVGAFLILLVSPIRALFFVIFVICLQQFEGSVIYPRVVGRSVGLPGVLTVSAVVVGSSIGGIGGALLSVPICAVLYSLVCEGVASAEAHRSGGSERAGGRWL